MCGCRKVEWVCVLLLLLLWMWVQMRICDFLRHVFIFTMLISFLVQDYPATHFETLIAHLQQPLPSIIINALSLLARLTAHSSSSGHTPPTLSPLFGPLLFGLGPAALPFHHTYLEYLRATNAMDHVLLAFVRWQDAPSNESSGSFVDGPGSAASLGVPTRLNDWIRGYPAMLPEPATRSRKHDRLQRHGARVSPFSSQTSDS